MIRYKKRIILLSLISVGCLLLSIIACNSIVVWNASGKTFDNIDNVPHSKVGMLLATSPITPGGAHNFYFDNRITAANELFKAGKVDYIIASGGDYTNVHKNGCDEPKAIRDSLIARGVPEDVILLDYNGERTIHSVLNLRDTYGLDSVVFISQKYHNERAIYLAEQYGITAFAYNAKPSHIRRNRIKNTLREYLARVKMFMEIIKGEPRNVSSNTISYEYNDSIYIKYNHHRKVQCFVSEQPVQSGHKIYRLHLYYICCGDTVYAYEQDELDNKFEIKQFCDSMQTYFNKNYPLVGNRHKYWGYNRQHIINVLNDYVTVTTEEYSKDCSYGDAPHGDGYMGVWTYDKSGKNFDPTDIVNTKDFTDLEQRLIQAFMQEKLRHVGGENEPDYIAWLNSSLQNNVLRVENLALGKDGLIYSYDYNDGDRLPLCYAEQYTINIPFSSIIEMLTPQFRKTLKETHKHKVR